LADDNGLQNEPSEKAPVLLPPYAAALRQTFGNERLSRALAAMRTPDALMTAQALSRLKASNLSFTRSLIDRMREEKWSIRRIFLDIEPSGAGLVVYRIGANGRVMTFAAGSDALDEEERPGRIRDEKLDFYSALYDMDADLPRIKAETQEQISKVWKGRTDNDALGWTFANRSNRFFELAIQSLARGQQPDLRQLSEGGGYLVRNAGFYGNGRHGCRTWAALPSDHPLSEPYHVDLFSVYMYRQVSFDYVEALAKLRNPDAASLSPAVKRHLGVGNSSGIGMVAALVRWPHWVSGFCFLRELALALAITEEGAPSLRQADRISDLLRRAATYYRQTDQSIDPALEDRKKIARELDEAVELFSTCRQKLEEGSEAASLGDFQRAAQDAFSEGTAEQIRSILIDSRPDIVSALRPCLRQAMASKRDIVASMIVDELLAIIERDYGWALAIDQSSPEARRYFWYRSAENGENRRGERDLDPGLEFETFVDVAGHIKALHERLASRPNWWTVARYLLTQPDDAYLVSRVQLMKDRPYGEIRANIIDEAFRPADLIRFYLSVLGMETTNPNNFRWVRGVFLQGAPLPEEIAEGVGGDWILPIIPELDGGRMIRAFAESA
jgi:hypothetical protein